MFLNNKIFEQGMSRQCMVHNMLRTMCNFITFSDIFLLKMLHMEPFHSSDHEMQQTKNETIQLPKKTKGALV